MKCNEVQELLSAWLDGELGRKQSADLQAHTADCGACRAELSRFAALDDALGRLVAPVPPGLAEKVMARLQPRRRHWWQSLALAASLVMGIVLGGALARDFFPVPSENGAVAEMATLEAFHDFPQGSLGAILASYQPEEGNGNET